MNHEDIARAMGLLGLQKEDFIGIKEASSVQEAQNRLERMKAKARKGYKKAVLENHPDRCNNDPAKADILRLLREAYDELMVLTVAPVERKSNWIQLKMYGKNLVVKLER